MKRSLKKCIRMLLGAFAVGMLLGGILSVYAEPDEGSSSEAHVHDFSGPYTNDDTSHWKVCACGERDEGSVSPHVFPSTPEYGEERHIYTCSVCGYVREEEHNYLWFSEEDGHWQKCACGKRTSKTAHRPDREEATEDDPVLCIDCGYEIEPAKSRYTIKLAQDDNSDYADFENDEYYLTGVKQYYALEDERVTILITDPEAPSIYVVDRLLFTDFEGREVEEIFVDGRSIVYFQMPDHNVLVQVELEIDPDKAEESMAEESRSVEESEALESSIAESIAEAKRLSYGKYVIETDVSGVTPPKNFIRANDVSNFARTVGCFYSTDYRIFVYYASPDRKEREFDYYVLDRIGESLIPFVTFPGTGNNSYVVSAPASEKDIPGIFRQETDVTLNFAIGDEAVKVPAFLIVDPDGDTLTLLYLNDDQGNQQFFVYDDSNGAVELTEYGRYEERKKNGEKESEDKIVITTASESDAAPKQGKTELSRGVIWLIIVGVIVVLLAAALITVFIMSKQQEAKERELDDEEDFDDEVEEPSKGGETPAGTEDPEGAFPEEEEAPETFDTTLYKNPDPTDMTSGKEAADFDFENAFPSSGLMSQGTGAVSEGAAVETEKIIDFEEIDAGSSGKKE